MQPKQVSLLFLLIISAILATVYFNSLIAPAGPVDPRTVVGEISGTRFKDNVAFLASDEMKGRGDGTPELEKAAEYIASQFRLSGLPPAGEADTYFQKFEVTTGSDIGTHNEVIVDGAPLRLQQDFVPIRFSSNSHIESPVTFAGYGITAPELNYDDYAGIDAKDKVVIVFRHNPQESDPHSRYALHAELISKAINARQHGADGIIFITDPNNHSGEDDAVGPATKNAEPDDVGIASIHARRDAVAKLFTQAGKSLADLQKEIDSSLKPISFELPAARINISTDIVRARKTVRNVLAAIPGSDPQLKNEWVVVGGHYDHLGLGERDSLAPSLIGQVHHGADDNASGTAGVLEIARVVAANPHPRRSILFMTFAGEELGLLGSSYFVNHPTIPLDKVAAMINMDMIGRLQNERLYVGGVGTSTDFKSWMETLNRPLGFNLDFSDTGYGSSDHTSFTIKRIPVLFFFSGLHSDYHKPSDTADKINADGARKILSLVYLSLDRLANAESRPQFVQVQQEQPAGGGGGGYGPYFGSIPDFRDDLKGVLFADVQPNSPAAKAGLLAGDLMTEFAGQGIQNLYDFTFALRAKKPGDVVAVVVKRNGQEVKTNVTLEARK
jgi:Zn-dependent M28 family amino/carboxypeptidase